MAGRKRSLKPKTSLVVVSYNGYEVTKKCLDSIFRNSGDSSLYEVILVDNASTDESKSRLITRYANRSNFSCVSLNSNTFLTAAYNAGFMKSRADVLVFMNNDTTMTPQWLDKILSKFESKSVGIVGVSLLSGKSPDYIDSQGCSLNVLGYGFRINSGKKYSQKLEMEEPFFIAGSVLAVRRNLFQKTGMFDEAYDGNYEDVDLAWRIRLLGYSIEVAYDAIVYHYGSWSVAKFFDAHHSSYLCRKNRLMTLLKNGSNCYLGVVLPFYLLSVAVLFFKELIIDLSVTKALVGLRAIAWNICKLPTILEKRKRVQTMARVPAIEVIKKMKLV